MEYVESIAEDIGGGGDRQAIIHMKSGHDLFIAYATIGVYAPGDLDRMNAGAQVSPLAMWDYIPTVSYSFGGVIHTESPIDRDGTYTADTGGHTLVDVVMLRGLQELIAPTAVCLTITDECIVYRAFDDLAFGCPLCEGDHEDGPEAPMESRSDGACALSPFGHVYI